MIPVIIAICGKSASGKDTLAKAFIEDGYGFTNIVSDTTRPPRKGERDGIDYNFLSVEEFQEKQKKDKYLETSKFRGWYYGTDKDSACGKINVGVFNMDGIISLLHLVGTKEYKVIPVYIKVGVFTRLVRSVKREHKLSLEMIRRVFADWRDFAEIDIWLQRFPQYIVQKKLKTMQNYHELTQYIVSEYLSDYYK